jgi:peptide chain release factor 1
MKGGAFSRRHRLPREGAGGRFEYANEILLEVCFGEGGQDSKDFVAELFAAYVRYAEANGCRAEVVDSSGGHIAARVSGPQVFRLFQHETGQHSCQRVPRTERAGRRHTSLIAVAVLPIHEDVIEPLNMNEVEVTFQCGGGPGGQKVNKTASAVRAKHVPTGLHVFIQTERGQAQNKAEALRILSAKVNDQRRAKENGDYAKFRREQLGDGGRGCKIRTYNFIESRVTDHQLDKKTRDIAAVMRGDFSFLDQ